MQMNIRNEYWSEFTSSHQTGKHDRQSRNKIVVALDMVLYHWVSR